MKHHLDRIVNLFKEELEHDLVGVYLHGSLAMGCFNPQKSDLDLLIISRGKQSSECYKRMARKLLMIEDDIPNGNKIELSIVLESFLIDFVYPTPFEFHYSAVHSGRYRSDENYLCGGFEDPDIAAHIVVTYNRGITLFGKPIHETFKPIDKLFIIQSIKSDIDGALEGIIENPEYYVLNLCRALYFFVEGNISSKREGGEWAARILPVEYLELVDECLATYKGDKSNLELNDQLLINFVGYMSNEMEKSLKSGS
jgi:predicted nucleotidyltransferase